MLERETAREKQLEKTQKEAKIRARKGHGRSTIAVVPQAAAAAGESEDLLQVRCSYLFRQPKARGFFEFC